MQGFQIAELIEKESITAMSFDENSTVVQNPDIQRKIADALLLGNSYHTKVSILFKSDEGIKRVVTTIWAYGNKHVCLKGGIWIPFDSIIDVDLV